MADNKEIVNVADRPWSYDEIEYWINPKDKCCNAVINFKEKRTRLRAGILIVKDDEILLGEEAGEEGAFALPGGGLNEGETPIEAATREAQEEVYINVKNAQETGYDYCECHTEIMDWVKDNVPKSKWWYNYYTCLIIAEYDSDFMGHVDDVDKDSTMKTSSRWYKIADVINKPSFKKQWRKALAGFGYYNLALNEDHRAALISKSRSAGAYTGDTSRGKNRFERKKYSKVAHAVKQYNQIDMNDFYKKDILTVRIPVQGETNNYTVSVRLNGVCAEMAKNIKSNQNRFEYRTAVQAITKIFNTTDVYVNCTCDDYKYRFAHWNIVHGVSTDDTSKDPGPGKGIRNPQDDKGRGCKHILLVLNNGDWLLKVASVICNYTHYAEEHMQKPFLNIIFPKLYGIPAAEMVEQGLIDDENFLDSSAGLIDAINDYGRKRGQYTKGSNKNPVTGTGGRQKKEEPSKEGKEAESED